VLGEVTELGPPALGPKGGGGGEEEEGLLFSLQMQYTHTYCGHSGIRDIYFTFKL
jgi:hypothetical protein